MSRGEYILGDSGYRLLGWLLTPYSGQEVGHADNMQFNGWISGLRVKVEHVNGILKSRWTSLNGIRTQNRVRNQIKHTVDWIQACCTLHNMLIFMNDEWEAIVETPDEDEYRIPASAESSLEEGKALRRRIQSFM